MTAMALDLIRDIIQEDVGNRGLRSDPSMNLISAFPGDFAAACESLATSRASSPPSASLAGYRRGTLPACDSAAGKGNGHFRLSGHDRR